MPAPLLENFLLGTPVRPSPGMDRPKHPLRPGSAVKTAPQICRSPTEFWVNIRNLLTFPNVILSARTGNYIKIRKIKLQPVPWGITISMSKAYRLAGAVAAPLLTAGCGMPIGVQIASFLADTVSVITTDKTLTDHNM